MPSEVYLEIEPDLVTFGEKCRHDIRKLGEQCEAEPPKLTYTSAWGQQGVELVTSSAWKAQKAISGSTR